MPTVMHARIWHMYRNMPAEAEPSIPVPTAPVMNSGPELLVNASSRSASVLVRALLFLRSDVILAPTG